MCLACTGWLACWLAAGETVENLFQGLTGYIIVVVVVVLVFLFILPEIVLRKKLENVFVHKVLDKMRKS